MNQAPHLEPTNIRRHRSKLVTKAAGARGLCTPVLNNFVMLFWNACSYNRWFYNGFVIKVQWLRLKTLGPFNKRVMLISYMHTFKTSFNIILLLQFTCRSTSHFITTMQIQTTFTLRTSLFWVITQRVVVIPYRLFGITYRSHLQGKF